MSLDLYTQNIPLTQKESINQSINKPINNSTSQSINQSINYLMILIQEIKDGHQNCLFILTSNYFFFILVKKHILVKDFLSVNDAKTVTEVTPWQYLLQ